MPESNVKINIYQLIDPLTLDIRYVGKTVGTINSRLVGHCKEGKEYNSRKYQWIKYLESKGLIPIIEILDVVDVNVANLCEEYWIRYYRDKGIDLYNLTEGGDGVTGFSNKKGKTLEEICGVEKANRMKTIISMTHKGKKLPMDLRLQKIKTLRNIACSRKGRTNIEIYGEEKAGEIFEKSSKSLKGLNRGPKNAMYNRKHNESARRKMSLAWSNNPTRVPWNKGLTKETDERVARYGSAQKGKPKRNKIQ